MTVYRQGLDISTELWVALLQDGTVFEEKDVDLMEALFNCKNHRATATELAEILDVPYYGVIIVPDSTNYIFYLLMECFNPFLCK
jgi:hypothetical protein